jgi:uncharacterized coiled-coil DUF342 family protein
MKKKTKTSTDSKKPAKAVSPKSPGKVVASKPKPKSAKTSKTPSVDEVILKYEKERTTLNSQLGETRKMIQELESKSRKLQDEISALRSREEMIVSKVGEVDSRRDREVSMILVKLGVQVGDILGAVSGLDAADSKTDETTLENHVEVDENSDSSDSPDGDDNDKTES